MTSFEVSRFQPHDVTQWNALERCTLMPRPHPLTRERIWWLLSTSLSEQSWFLNEWMIISKWLMSIWHCAIHWLVQNWYCWLGTTKEVLNINPLTTHDFFWSQQISGSWCHSVNCSWSSVVSSPGPTLSQGKGSGDHDYWALPCGAKWAILVFKWVNDYVLKM